MSILVPGVVMMKALRSKGASHMAGQLSHLSPRHHANAPLYYSMQQSGIKCQLTERRLKARAETLAFESKHPPYTCTHTHTHVRARSPWVYLARR